MFQPNLSNVEFILIIIAFAFWAKAELFGGKK